MKVYKTLVTATIVCLSIISCNKDDLNGDTIEITGTIQKSHNAPIWHTHY
jgi:hypothetical protein